MPRADVEWRLWVEGCGREFKGECKVKGSALRGLVGGETIREKAEEEEGR